MAVMKAEMKKSSGVDGDPVPIPINGILSPEFITASGIPPSMFRSHSPSRSLLATYAVILDLVTSRIVLRIGEFLLLHLGILMQNQSNNLQGISRRLGILLRALGKKEEEEENVEP
eukprot:TRINITY_DN6561_c0_g1_i5.p1 TRINITY_DN6561_c0_g1~~TRINITY_DN6561_c0_g1_i5.p1  ORF type:complete len:116 (+),score=30.02 TRINITY_DN6561_c0_g1_i5:826-1173(+)